MRRFLQNIAGLANLMTVVTRDIDQAAQMQQKYHQEHAVQMNRLAEQATQQFKIEAPKAFAEYYGAPITPICGDYLSSIAMAKLNQPK